jgi:signal transduction histidine kinase
LKSLLKIVVRYITSAVAVAITILLLNLIMFLSILTNSGNMLHNSSSAQQIAEHLKKENSVYLLSDDITQALASQKQWAMLINEKGDVSWKFNIPPEIPKHYTISEVAGFTRWYLKDYPVHVWEHPDGLVVLGYPKDSIWKHDMVFPLGMIKNSPLLFTTFLIVNTAVAIILSFLFAFRLFRSLRNLTKGIHQLATMQPVFLPAHGVLSDLANGINKASLKLIRQEEALNKRDTARTTWIAGISHDIRTPLSIVMGYSSQLETDFSLPPDKREQAGLIRRQGEKIKNLVNDLNLASKLEYEMQPLRFNLVSISPLLREIAVDFLNNSMTALYHLDLQIADDAQDIVIEGDVELLRRAVSNLITNSMTHNPDGCSIQISLTREASNCIIIISDNGTGFTREMLHTLNHQKASVELTAHGLGLIIVRQVITVHKGTAQFLNQDKNGCRVILYLPVLSS